MGLLNHILESKLRLRILMVLAELEELNVTQLAKLTGTSYTSIMKHVNALEEVGLVKTVTIGRMRVIKLNTQSPAYSMVKELAKILKDLDKLG